MAMPAEKLAELYNLLPEHDKELASDMIERLTYNCEPNVETIAAIEEAEQLANDPNTKRYKSVDELFKELDAE